MPLDLPVRYSNGVSILASPGSTGSEPLALFATPDTGVDNSRLGELVAAYAAVAQRGVASKLLHVSDRVAKLLSVARLDRLVESYADKTTPIASFRNAPNAKARAALDGFLKS